MVVLPDSDGASIDDEELAVVDRQAQPSCHKASRKVTAKAGSNGECISRLGECHAALGAEQGRD